MPSTIFSNGAQTSQHLMRSIPVVDIGCWDGFFKVVPMMIPKDIPIISPIHS